MFSKFLDIVHIWKYQKITKLACKERLPAFLNLSKWNSKKLPIKTEIDTNDTIIYKVLNKPLAGKFLCRILFFIRKQTLTPAVSPANLGTQTNSNMTRNGARRDLHATQNHHLKTGPSHLYAHRALTADKISGKHSICTKCELADVIIDQGQGHGEPEVEFRAQKTAFLTPTFNHTNWRQGQEIQQLLGYLRRTEKCLRGGWKAHDTREPPSARPSDPIDSRHKNARLC